MTDINNKCIVCEEPLKGIQRKFCSNTCKQKNFYDKQAPKEKPTRWRSVTRKLYLIGLRGGKCEQCPYDKNLAALDFHHIDPSTKEFQLDTRNLSSLSFEVILKEFEKCKVLCANCHREEHGENLFIEDLKKRIVEKDIEKELAEKEKKFPACVDCGGRINYTYKRCKKCEYKKRSKLSSVDRAGFGRELKDKGRKWCKEKYNVSYKTLDRWKKVLYEQKLD